MNDQLTAEWKRYDKAVKDFEKQMKAKEFHFSIICQMLSANVIARKDEWKKDPIKMVIAFTNSIDSELKMARSCDAPNKPGYYRANND